MKDFPFFTTEYGVASLVLKEIPYTKTAYIHIRETSQPKALLDECSSFCIAAGADVVIATGNSILEEYPLHATIVHMQVQRDLIPETDAALFPVQMKTLERWRNIYNARMKNVPNAAYLDQNAANELFITMDLYFVHRGDQLLGIGAINESKIEALASVECGSGLDVACALCNGIIADMVSVEVAIENEKAMNLYNKIGFLPVKEISKWYRVK